MYSSSVESFRKHKQHYKKTIGSMSSGQHTVFFPGPTMPFSCYGEQTDTVGRLFSGNSWTIFSRLFRNPLYLTDLHKSVPSSYIIVRRTFLPARITVLKMGKFNNRSNPTLTCGVFELIYHMQWFNRRCP